MAVSRVFLFFVFASASTAVAQQINVSISGPTNVNQFETGQYFAEFRNEYGQLITPLGEGLWSTYGGNVTSTGSEFSYIQWVSAGPGHVYYEYDDGVNYYFTSLSVNVVGTAPPTPVTTFTFERYCGTTKVIRTSSPSTGEWFWQTSPAGTSTLLGSTDNIIVSSGPLYLRAKSGTLWSAELLQVEAIPFLSSPPPAPVSRTNGDVITNGTSTVVLSVGSVAGATSYKWYATDGYLAAATTLPSHSFVVSGNTTFQVASAIDFCESVSRIAVSANVYPEPVITATNNARISPGNPVILSIDNFDYDYYEWFMEGEPSFVNGVTFEVPGEGIYKVRVRKGASTLFEAPVGVQVWAGLNGQNVNYIVSNIIQVSGVTDESSLGNLSEYENMKSVQYFDGLGRLMQTVINKGSPQKQDLVQPTVYDAFGRESHKYLPYASGNTGVYKSNFLQEHEPGYESSEQYQFYQNGGLIAHSGGKAYAITRFEKSPLNRVLEQGAAGPAWQPDEDDSYQSSDRTVKFGYELNGVNEVLMWSYVYPDQNNPSGSVTAFSGDAAIYYSPNELFKNKTKDENGSEVIEFIDKEGRVVLRKVQAILNTGASVSAWAQTYYVYDDFGNLVTVIPPEAVKVVIEKMSKF